MEQRISGKEQRISGGIKQENIENYQEYKKHIVNMICCICLDVVCKPVECYLCETLICNDCFQILQIAGKRCITNKCKGNVRKSNKFVREILSNLKIKCYYCQKEALAYHEYISHLEKCEFYKSSDQYKLLEAIDEKEKKINELTKEVDIFKSKLSNSSYTKVKDPFANVSKEGLRSCLMTYNLPLKDKMELYNACVEGKVQEYKNLVINKKFPILEEVSANKYYWSTLHYAMHYGRWEIVKFICEYLYKNSMLESAFRLESNDGRCPTLCCLRSNAIEPSIKTEIINSIFTTYPFIQFSIEVKKEMKNRGFDILLNKINK